MASKVLIDDPKKFEEFITKLFIAKDINHDGRLDYNEIKELLNIYADKCSEIRYADSGVSAAHGLFCSFAGYARGRSNNSRRPLRCAPSRPPSASDG